MVLTQSSIGCEGIPIKFISHAEFLQTIMANGHLKNTCSMVSCSELHLGQRSSQMFNLEQRMALAGRELLAIFHNSSFNLSWSLSFQRCFHSFFLRTPESVNLDSWSKKYADFTNNFPLLLGHQITLSSMTLRGRWILSILLMVSSSNSLS